MLLATTEESQGRKEKLRQTSGGEEADGRDEEVPPTKYTIHVMELEGNLTTYTANDNSIARLPRFILDEVS